MTNQAFEQRDPVRPGERLVTQFTPAQRGWAAAIFIAFLGVAFGGPALTRLGRKRRRAQSRIAQRARDARDRVQTTGTSVRRKMHRLGTRPIWR